MRLQCPNCDAEYEVDAAAIPQEGRDVQCSNCGHGWYQNHPDFEPDYELDSALFEPPPQYAAVAPAFPKNEIKPAAMQILREEAAREEALRAAEQNAQAQAEPKADAAAAAAPDAVQSMPQPQPIAQQMPSTQPVPQRQRQPDDRAVDDRAVDDRAVDDGAFEANLDALHDQELPMPRYARVTRGRIARLRGEDTAEPALQVEPMSGPPPSIIGPAPTSGDDWGGNAGDDDRMGDDQTSDADDLRNMLAPAHAHAPKSGRRAGAYTAIMASLIAAAAYVMGPDLAARLPALAPYLASYVDWVNALRDWVQIAVPAGLEFAASLVQMLRGWIGV